MRWIPVVFVLILIGFSTAARGADRPNILFIMADDHTTQAFKAYGSRLAEHAPTPNINRIARQGATLMRAYTTNSVCVPSRAAILTGQYSQKNGVYTNRDRLAPGHPNVAKELQDVGYRTAVIGKWHLKANPSGFDYFNVLRGQGSYFNPRLENSRTGQYTRHKGFSADVIGDLSLKWLKQQAANEQPFMLMTHFKASHGPFSSPSRNDSMYQDVTLPEPPSLWANPESSQYGFTMDSMAHRLKQSGEWDPPRPLDKMTRRQRVRHGYQAFVKQYLRCVAAIDQNVGRILDYLNKAGLKKNTIVIYTSDQGYFLGEHNYMDKRWMYEQSIRMPFLIRYPGHIEAETEVNDLILNVDYAPLLLDYAGAEVPDYMQGRSFRASLEGETPKDPREAIYYRYWNHWQHPDGALRPAHYGLRTERYKLIFFYGLPLDHTYHQSAEPTEPRWELYDLAKDPHELDNVYNDPAYAQTVKRLKRKLLEKKKHLDDTDEKFPRLMEVREQAW